MAKISTALSFCFVIAQPIAAQSYVPVGPANASGTIPLQWDNVISARIGKEASSVLAFRPDSATVVATVRSSPSRAVSPAALAVCSPAPSLEQLAQSPVYNQALLTRAAAVQLGVLGASASGSTDEMVVVRDWTRSAPCTATDGKTTLIYGQAVRVVIRVAAADAQAGLSLPVLAASATIHRGAASVTVSYPGYAGEALDTVVANLAGKELNVETYRDFDGAEHQLLQHIHDSTVTSTVARLGVAADETESGLRTAVTTAYAVYQIQRKAPCKVAQQNFPDHSTEAATAIETAYVNLTSECTTSPPDAVSVARATQLMGGMRVN